MYLTVTTKHYDCKMLDRRDTLLGLFLKSKVTKLLIVESARMLRKRKNLENGLVEDSHALTLHKLRC